jgi:hypothetical protein
MPPIRLEIKPSPLLVDPPLPSDPKVRPALDDLLARLKVAFVMAASDVQPAAPDGVDGVFHEFMTTRGAQARASYRAGAQRLLAQPELRAQHFGRHATTSAATYQTTGFQGLGRIDVAGAGAPPDLKLALSPALMTWWQEQQAKQQQAAADLQAGQAFTKLRLKILDVRCFEETDEWGSDEIAIGGVYTGPFGGSLPVDQTVVSEDFDEGEDVPMHLTFCEWGIDQNPDWPHYYGAIVMLCEKDDGGFWDMIHKLWDKVAPEVKELIAMGVGAAVGGSFAGALGAIVGAVIGALVGWIINLFDNADDLLGSRTLTMTLASNTKSYYDWAQLTAPGGYPFQLQYHGDGSHYQVTGAFKVYTQ